MPLRAALSLRAALPARPWPRRFMAGKAASAFPRRPRTRLASAFSPRLLPSLRTLPALGSSGSEIPSGCVWGFSSKLGIGPRRPHPAGKPLWRPHCGGTTHRVDTHPQANDGRAASRPAAWPQPPSRVPTPVPPSPLFPSPWGSKCPRMHRDGRSLQPQPHAALTALSSPMLAPMSAPMSGLMGTPRGKT